MSTQPLTSKELFRYLYQHGNLQAKRHPFFQRSRFSNAFNIIMSVLAAGYFIFMGVMMAVSFKDAPKEPYHYINGVLPLIFILDYIFRCAMMKETNQMMGPYRLLPIPRKRLLDMLLLRGILDWYNLIWMFFFIPFALVSVLPYYGLWGVLTYAVGIWLFTVLNALFFQVTDALCKKRVWYYAIPTVYFGGLIFLYFFLDDFPITDFFTEVGEGMIQGRGLTFLLLLLSVAVMFLICRSVLGVLCRQEMEPAAKEKVRGVGALSFLNRYGQIGGYLLLEFRLYLRNKMPKRTLLTVLPIVLMFSAFLTFTDMYQGGMITFFLCYNFIVVNMILSTIMSYEGNYIDCLMSRKESISALLTAKLIFAALITLLPLAFSIPMMVLQEGKWLTCIALYLFTVGANSCLFMQLAVYNDVSLPLNGSLTAQKNMGKQSVKFFTMGAMAVPIILKFVLDALLEWPWGDLVLAIIGLGFILTHRLWIKNIYRRFMERRYKNMEGMRATREQ